MRRARSTTNRRKILREIVDRASARSRGLSRFYTGKPCKRGHITDRHVVSGSCVLCLRAVTRQKEAANPDLRAARVAKCNVRKRYPDAIVEGYTARDFVEFYAKARELTRSTGIQYVVDHIAPLVHGGKHTPSNVQVLTQTENRAKGASLQCVLPL